MFSFPKGPFSDSMSFLGGQTILYPIGFEGFEDALPAKVINRCSNFVYPATLSESSTISPYWARPLSIFFHSYCWEKLRFTTWDVFQSCWVGYLFTTRNSAQSRFATAEPPQIPHLLHQAAASKLSPAIRLACWKAGGPMLKMTPRVFVVFLKISMSTFLWYNIRTAVDYR